MCKAMTRLILSGLVALTLAIPFGELMEALEKDKIDATKMV